MMAIKVLLANVVKEYVIKQENVTRIADIRLKQEILLVPSEPIKIQIQRRSSF